MSAFLCSAVHIGGMVAWYADNPPPAMQGRSGRVDRRAMAAALAMCNLHSLAYRYPDEDQEKQEANPQHHMTEDAADRVVRVWSGPNCNHNNALAFVAACVIEAEKEQSHNAADAGHLAGCLDYQCCEHPEYPEDGQKTIDRIKQRANELAGVDRRRQTVGWGI